MQIDDITCTTSPALSDQNSTNSINNTSHHNNVNGTFVFKEESLDDLLEEGLRKYRHVRKARSLDESSTYFTNLMLQTSKQIPTSSRNQLMEEPASHRMFDSQRILPFNTCNNYNNSSSMNNLSMNMTNPPQHVKNMLTPPDQSEFSQNLYHQRVLMSQNPLISKTQVQPSQSYRRNSMFEMSQTNNSLSTFNNFHLGSIPSPDNNNNNNMQYQGSDSDSSSNFQLSTPSISVTNLSNNNTGKKKRITITNSNVPQSFDFNQRRNSSSSNSSVTFNTNEYQDFYHGIHETQQKDKKRKALKFTEFTPNNLKR